MDGSLAQTQARSPSATTGTTASGTARTGLGGLRRGPILLLLAGLLAATVVTAWLGAGKVFAAVASVGVSGFFLLVGWQFVVFVVLAAAWWCLCPGARPGTALLGRLVREGGTNCLPLSEIGGLAFGARALALGGVPWPRALASSIADVAAEFIGEIPFILGAALLFLGQARGGPLLLPVGIGLALMAAGAAGLAWAGKHPHALFRALGRRLSARWARHLKDGLAEVEAELDATLARPGRIALAAGLHFLGWIGGGVTVWLACGLLGHGVGLLPAMAIEGVLSGALAVAFLVPLGLGVQEVSYVALAGLFGVPAHVALGLSLLRRARDIAIGAPALLGWQALEARRLRRGQRR